MQERILAMPVGKGITGGYRRNILRWKLPILRAPVIMDIRGLAIIYKSEHNALPTDAMYVETPIILIKK